MRHNTSSHKQAFSFVSNFFDIPSSACAISSSMFTPVTFDFGLHLSIQLFVPAAISSMVFSLHKTPVLAPLHPFDLPLRSTSLQEHDITTSQAMNKPHLPYQRPLPRYPAKQRRVLLLVIITLLSLLCLELLCLTLINTLQPPSPQLNITEPTRPIWTRDCVTCFTSSGQAYCCKDGGPKKHVTMGLIIGLCIGLGVPLLVILWYVWCCCCFDASMV